jgi:hypothetical protein
MAKGASSRKLRNIFLTTNKYQDRIILLTFLPSTLMFLLFIGIVFIVNPDISDAVLHTSFLGMEKFILRFPWLIVFLMCLILWLSMIGAYVTSLNMVGAFRRIIYELDEIIAGRSQKDINSRPDDDLSKELLKRINVLIEHYVGNKNKK